MDTSSDSGSPDGKRTGSRRQFAFYPNMNSTNKPTKPFSRSAAKRESVMALGSIEHLQHYFTKTGIQAEKNPSNKPNNGMVPAIGGLHIKSSRLWPEGIPEFQLPPSPVVPQAIPPAVSPYVKTYDVDPENLRPSVIEDLSSVERSWWLAGVEQTSLLSAQDAHRNEDGAEHVDVLDVLRTTTHAVRSVRNYLLSLPDDGITPVKPHHHFRPPTTSTAPIPRRQVSLPDSASDPLSRIRRSALEVLTVLRSVEEATRLPLSDDAYDAQSDHGDRAESISGGSTSASGSGSGSGSGSTHSRATSPDFLSDDVEAPVSISYMHVSGRHGPVPVWEDEDDIDLNHTEDEERAKRDHWEERLVLGGGWLYRQDVTREKLVKEREVIARYLNAVDEVLFGGRIDGKRGWEREREKEAQKDRGRKSRRISSGSNDFTENKRQSRRVVSTGMLDVMQRMTLTEEPEEGGDLSETESLEDDDLPEWAKRSSFVNDELGRLRAMLQALLPQSLAHLLPSSPTDRVSLLNTISSGQLLCVAYNIGVRKSRKPWGYVNKDAIHDIAALEAETTGQDGDQEFERAKRGWTFRRTDNLRLWAAALKLRYSIPVYTPPSAKPDTLAAGEATTPTTSPSPSSPMLRFPTGEPPIVFDAPPIARKEPGWEDMLGRLVLRWMQAVINEKRGSDSLRV